MCSDLWWVLHSYSSLCDGTWHQNTIKWHYTNICLFFGFYSTETRNEPWNRTAVGRTHTLKVLKSVILSHTIWIRLRSRMSLWQTQWSFRLCCHYGNQPSVRRLFESRCAPIIFLMLGLSLYHLDCALNFEFRVFVYCTLTLTDLTHYFSCRFICHIKRKKCGTFSFFFFFS